MQGPAKKGAHLPGNSQERHGVPAVGGDAEVEDAVPSRHHLRQRGPNGSVGIEHEDSVVLVAQAELPARADHAVGHDPANLRALERGAVGQHAARARNRHLLSGGQIGRAADDLDGLALAQLDTADREVIRVRMGHPLQNPTDVDRREIRPETLDDDVLEAAEFEPFRQLTVRRKRDELREPVERDTHQSCSRTRTSLSKSSRKCGRPKRCMAVRSIPIPKAKP